MKYMIGWLKMSRYDMKKRNINSHSGAVSYLTDHLEDIGIDQKYVSFILPEPVILKYNSVDRDKECDLIVGFEEPYNHSYGIEIKHSPSPKAIGQLQNTSRRLCDRLGYPMERQFILYYPSMSFQEIYFGTDDE